MTIVTVTQSAKVSADAAAASAAAAAASAADAAASAALVIRGPWVAVLDYVPSANRAAVIAGTYTGDASAWIQSALDTGKNVDLQGLTLYAHGLTWSTARRALFSSTGIANIYKNASGVILTGSGDDQVVRSVVFRGQSASYTGDNLVFTGERPVFDFAGSRDAAGRALKATGNEVQIRGTCSLWHTADATATGYDIEIGQSGVATLYHQLVNIYSSQATGGILLIDTGSHAISGGSQFGKLYIKNSLSPSSAVGGCNGGMISAARILGAVTVEQSGATFVNNQFGAISVTLAAGTTGVSIDVSNTWENGSSFTNNGNGNQCVVRNVSTGAFPILRYGPAADAVEVSYVNGTGVRTNLPVIVPNGFNQLKARNNAGTTDLGLLGVAQSSDSVFLGHGTGTGTVGVLTGSGGFVVNVAGTNAFSSTTTLLAPSTDNTLNLGSNTLRFPAVYAYAFNVANGFAGYKARNNANSGDLSLIALAQSSDSVFVGHGGGTSSVSISAGSGGINDAVSGSTVATTSASRYAPAVDNAFDLGTTALRFKDGYSYTWDAKTSFKVNGTKVIGAQDTGWTAATGTANKGAYATYAGQTVSAAYVQAEAQATDNATKANSQRIKALEDMLRTHGLMN
jgi:hypothetical protein